MLALDSRCLTSKVDIFPAPTIATRASAKLLLGSFIWQSSAAAELTETAPLEMEVSDRTLLPAVIACEDELVRDPCVTAEQIWVTTAWYIRQMSVCALVECDDH